MGCQKWSDLAKSGPPSGPLLVAEKGPPGLKWAAKSGPTLPKVIHRHDQSLYANFIDSHYSSTLKANLNLCIVSMHCDTNLSIDSTAPLACHH